MQGSFSSRTYNFNTLLGRSSFPDYGVKRVIVPPFQRGFSWEKGHVESYWDDVLEFHRKLPERGSAEMYFLGPIVIMPQEDGIQLLDGQQRLATTTILLSAIRDIARQQGGQMGSDLARDIQRDLIMVDEEDDTYALDLSELDKTFFRQAVQQDPPNSSAQVKLRSHRLIEQARSFLLSKVQGTIGDRTGKELVQSLKELKRSISERIKIVAIEVNSEDEAFMIFETLNDRGLRLSVPDLLLNHLMHEARSPQERNLVRENWNNILEHIMQRKVSTFLRHMWVSKYGDVKSQGLFREIRDRLRGDRVTTVEFSQVCADEAERYVAILQADKDRIGDAEPHVKVLLNSLGAEKGVPLLMSGLVNLESAHFVKLAKDLLDLTVRHSVFANLNPADLESTLFLAARKVRELAVQGASSRDILNYVRSSFARINPSLEQLYSAIGDIHLTKPQAQYVVNMIAERVQSPTKALTLSKTSIEHVFPLKVDPSDWPDSDRLMPYQWHLGNLTSLEPTYNRAVGNKPYAQKTSIYHKSEITLTREIPQKFPTWSVDSILSRAKALLKHADQIWPGPPTPS